MRKFAPLRWIITAVFIAIIAAAGYYSFSAAQNIAVNSPFEGTGSFTPANGNAPTPEGIATPQEGQSPGEAQPGSQGAATPEAIPASGWEGSERITILILGVDFRDWETGAEAPRSDTMILLTIDPLTNTAGMLSIPRDLWVQIPGFQYDRINTAYRTGEVYDLPGGGPQLAVETVEQLVGVKIDYFAQVDFNVFVRMIDEIGGVKIDVTEPVTIDLIGPEPPKTIQPGRYTMPGDVALAYARSRKTEGGDFDRALRQQQVILAIRDRILSFDLLPILLTKSGILYNELASGVRTDMSLETAIDLGLLAINIPLENIRRGTIGEEQIIFYTTPSGDQVLKPLPDQIRILRDYVFGTAGLSSPLAGLTAAERVQAENASISLLNGTFFEGLAGSTAEFLAGLGLVVPAENLGNADQNYIFTQIIDYTGNPYTVQMLVDALGIQPHLIYLRYDPNSPVDIVVNLGDDWAGQLP